MPQQNLITIFTAKPAQFSLVTLYRSGLNVAVVFPDHGEHGEPHVRERLGREAAVPDAQHVRHRLEQRPRVLLEPVGLLEESRQMEDSSEFRWITYMGGLSHLYRDRRAIRRALGCVNLASWLPLASWR